MEGPGSPLFSVIIPTFQRAATIARAIEGVLGQTFADFELIVVDDGSTDGTADIVAAYTDERLSYVAQRNGGVADARNTGARRARGRYLVFLDSDDYPMPVWLERFAALHRDRPFLLAFSANRYEDATGRFLYDVPPHPLGPVFCDMTGQFLPGGWAVDRSVFDDVGGYDVAVGFSANSELMIRSTRYCAARGFVPPVIEEPLVVMEHRGNRPVDTWRLADAEPFIAKYGTEFATYPKTWSLYLAVWGVSAARLRKFGLARRYLTMSLRLAPSRVNRIRRALTFLPGARELVWRPTRTAQLVRARTVAANRAGSAG